MVFTAPLMCSNILNASHPPFDRCYFMAEWAKSLTCNTHLLSSDTINHQTKRRGTAAFLKAIILSSLFVSIHLNSSTAEIWREACVSLANVLLPMSINTDAGSYFHPDVWLSVSRWCFLIKSFQEWFNLNINFMPEVHFLLSLWLKHRVDLWGFIKQPQ